LYKTLDRIKEFVEDRNWEKNHSPKNLSMSISIEAAELMEIFQWIDTDESFDILNTSESEHVKEELADVLIYCFSLCNQLGLDPITIMNSKIDKNAIKYPVNDSDTLDLQKI
jgi:NTP pyrophosphatase (non-canonical NTP hydrolase)